MLMTKEELKSPSFSCVIFPENYQSSYDKDKIRLHMVRSKTRNIMQNLWKSSKPSADPRKLSY